MDRQAIISGRGTWPRAVRNARPDVTRERRAMWSEATNIISGRVSPRTRARIRKKQMESSLQSMLSDTPYPIQILLLFYIYNNKYREIAPLGVTRRSGEGRIISGISGHFLIDLRSIGCQIFPDIIILSQKPRMEGCFTRSRIIISGGFWQ
jgi:hypothetical protein